MKENEILQNNNYSMTLPSLLSRKKLSTINELKYQNSTTKTDEFVSSDSKIQAFNKTHSLSESKTIEGLKRLNDSQNSMNSVKRKTGKTQRGLSFEISQTNQKLSRSRSQLETTTPLPRNQLDDFDGKFGFSFQPFPPPHLHVSHTFIPRPLEDDFEEYELYPLHPAFLPFHDYYDYHNPPPHIVYKPPLLPKGPFRGATQNQPMPESIQLFQTLQVNDNPKISDKSPLRIPSRGINRSNAFQNSKRDSRVGLFPFQNSLHPLTPQFGISDPYLHQLTPNIKQQHRRKSTGRLVNGRGSIMLSPRHPTLNDNFQIFKSNINHQQVLPDTFRHPTYFDEIPPRNHQF